MRKIRGLRLLFAILLCYGTIELVSWLVLTILSAANVARYAPVQTTELSGLTRASLERMIRGEGKYLGHHPVLGWSVRPGGAMGLNRANAQGLRGDRSYSTKPPPGVLRIAAFGDSFTHGYDVANRDTWPAKLDALMPAGEVLNFGVPAFGPGQGYLRYQVEGRGFHPHIVLIGYMSENISRALNVFRGFYTPDQQLALAKPRYLLEGDELVLLPNPLPTLDGYRELLADPPRVLPLLGEHDFYYHHRFHASPFDLLPSVRLVKAALSSFSARRRGGIFNRSGVCPETSHAFSLVVRILEAFYRSVIEDGGLPILLFIPDYSDLKGYLEGRPISYQPLLDRMQGEGYRCVDLKAPLAGFAGKHPVDRLFIGAWDHYSPRANELVARHIERYLVEQDLSTLSGFERHRARPRSTGDSPDR